MTRRRTTATVIQRRRTLGSRIVTPFGGGPRANAWTWRLLLGHERRRIAGYAPTRRDSWPPGSSESHRPEDPTTHAQCLHLGVLVTPCDNGLACAGEARRTLAHGRLSDDARPYDPRDRTGHRRRERP